MSGEFELEKPAFTFTDVRLPFDLTSEIEGLSISSNIIYVILANKIYRFSLDEPSAVDTLTIPNQFSKARITRHWVHPSGLHLIVQLDSIWHLYLHRTYDNFKVLARLNGLRINSISFKDEGSEVEQCEILLSTVEGSIYSCFLKAHPTSRFESKRDDKQVKQIYKCNKRVIGSLILSEQKKAYIITEGDVIMWEIPGNSLFKIPHAAPITLESFDKPKHYSFFADSKKFYFFAKDGNFLLTNDDGYSQSQLPESNEAFWSRTGGFVATSFFYIFLDEEGYVRVQDKLYSQAPFLLKDSKHLALKGLVSDLVHNTIWGYAADGIYEIKFENEQSSAWYGYYIKQRFDEALDLVSNARSKSTIYRALIESKKGYSLLQRGGFGMDIKKEADFESLSALQEEGIRTLARSSEPFEKIMLMLQDSGEKIASERSRIKLALEFLMEKISIALRQRDTVRFASLSAWVICLFGRAIHECQSNQPSMDTTSCADNLNAKLIDFLSTYHHALEFSTAIQILSRMGLASAGLHLALLKKEFIYIIDFYLEKEEWEQTAKTLSDAFEYDSHLGKELVYRSSMSLLLKAPSLAISAWLAFVDLDVQRLFPALFAYIRAFNHYSVSDNHAIQYLSKLIFERNLLDSTIANTYISILVRYNDDEKRSSTAALMKALGYFRGMRSSSSPLLYDAESTLRLALQFGKLWPAVSVMVDDLQLHESAMTLVLQRRDIFLAEFVLRRFEDSVGQDEEFSQSVINEAKGGAFHLNHSVTNLRKRLWLCFARYLITSSSNENLITAKSEYESTVGTCTSDIKQVVHYLMKFASEISTQKSVLDIKSIILLLPQSVEISNLKDEIVNSLDQSNDYISLLTIEMKESAQISLKLKSQLREVKTKFAEGHVGSLLVAGESCRLCSKFLLDRNIVVYFNCHHAFHKDCIARYYLKQRAEYRFKELFRKLRQSNSAADRERLEKIFVSRCIFCHDINLMTIDEDLIDGTGDKSCIGEWCI